MEFRVGQKVKIKSYDEIRAMACRVERCGDFYTTKDEFNSLFTNDMKRFCNKAYIIAEKSRDRVYFKESRGYYFNKTWLVQPKEVINR